jgi:hypothetical protein
LLVTEFAYLGDPIRTVVLSVPSYPYRDRCGCNSEVYEPDSGMVRTGYLAAMCAVIACTAASPPIVANQVAPRCDPHELRGSIIDLDNGNAAVAYATVAATGGHDRHIISRRGDVPLFDFNDRVDTDSGGNFLFQGLDAARHGLLVFFHDLRRDRMLRFEGTFDNPHCGLLRFGIHSHANNDDEKPLPLVRL